LAIRRRPRRREGDRARSGGEQTITLDVGGKAPNAEASDVVAVFPLMTICGYRPTDPDPVTDRWQRAPASPDLTAGPVRLISDASI